MGSLAARTLPIGTILLWMLATRPTTYASQTPQPVSVEFDDKFRGYDGWWSAAQVRVGTASPNSVSSAYLSLLPNTVNSEIWVVNAQSCAGNNSVECQLGRGGVFSPAESTTFRELGTFETGYNLAPSPLIAQYGLDVVKISDTLSAPNQSIAVFNSTDLYLGSLGLNAKIVRFPDIGDYPSFISTLVHNESAIPSHSYGYTAGAYYAERSIPGSLTLGGTDTTRYTPNNVVFQLSSENYNPLVIVKSVTVISSAQPIDMPPNWNANPLTLMDDKGGLTFTVDTSTPFLWMPTSICDAFASALNLTYDESLNLYVFSSGTSPQNLTNWNLAFRFTLAATPTSAETVTIPISYNAFNLQLKYPFPGFRGNSSSAAVNYFPLRKANSSLEYIIGRAFFQEAYLTVDYERGTFTIADAIFPDLTTTKPALVAITRPADSTWPAPQNANNSSGSSLSGGAKAGIAVGVVVAVAFGVLLAFLYLRRRRSRDDGESPKKSSFNLLRFVKQRKNSPNVMTELPADKRHPGEMQADATNTRFELHGSDPIEMPAGEIPSSYFEAHKETSELTPGGDRNRPSSISKGVLVTTVDSSERSQSPVPPYATSDSSGQVNTTSTTQSHPVSSGVSSQSTDNRLTFNGSHSSGEPGISPIAPTFTTGDFLTTSGSSGPTIPNLQHESSPILAPGLQDSLAHRLSVQNQTPNRTVSRSSRFREELTEEEPAASPEEERPKLVRHRFSWEE